MGEGRSEIPGGHDVSKIDALDEGLHGATSLDGLLRHSSVDSSGITLNTDNGAAVVLLLLAIGLLIELDDDSLLTSESTR